MLANLLWASRTLMSNPLQKSRKNLKIFDAESLGSMGLATRPDPMLLEVILARYPQ
jgi:hypothetical protein